MNPESENFESLRRLLALKRHEQPPPGYFDRFSREVTARIRAGETAEGRELAGTWLQRFWSVFEAKPVFAGLFGAAICAVLVSGILNAEVPGAAPEKLNAFAAPQLDATKYEQQPHNTNSIRELFGQFKLHAEPAAWNLMLPPGN